MIDSVIDREGVMALIVVCRRCNGRETVWAAGHNKQRVKCTLCNGTGREVKETVHRPYSQEIDGDK